MFSFGNKTKVVKTGQTAPTTATAGYLGQVIFDTDGKCWMLRNIDGSTYLWERLFTDIVLTQTEYDAIVTKDPNVRYMIVGA